VSIGVWLSASRRRQAMFTSTWRQHRSLSRGSPSRLAPVGDRNSHSSDGDVCVLLSACGRDCGGSVAAAARPTHQSQEVAGVGRRADMRPALDASVLLGPIRTGTGAVGAQLESSNTGRLLSRVRERPLGGAHAASGDSSRPKWSSRVSRSPARPNR
jgi:hypothetical protein